MAYRRQTLRPELSLLVLVSLALSAAAVRFSSAAADGRELQTIGDVTVVAGMEGIPVHGYGLVVGLNGTGSNPPPSEARTQLLHEMKKRGVPGPEKLLRSDRTALVVVQGIIPPGARRKDRIDVSVSLLPGDQARSLKGGWLLETILYESATLGGTDFVPGDRMAVATGPILVQEGGDERRGIISGGGICLVNRGFRLLTGNRFRSVRYTSAIERRINERFPHRGPSTGDIATAKDDTQVELRVPPVYEHNPARFLMVVRSLPLWSGAYTEEAIVARLERLGNELLEPAMAPAAAIALEGIGTRAIPVLKRALQSSDVDVRFFAAEALAYLGDPVAAKPLADIARLEPDYRAHALAALASLDEAASRLELHALLSEEGEAELRYGAFRALRLLDRLNKNIQGERLDGYIRLHVLPTSGPPLVHVTTRGEPEIVLFGHRQRLLTPLTLRAGDSILLVANSGSTNILLSRYAVNRPPVKEPIPLELDEVIRRVVQMGARYPDVVEMLQLAYRNLNLPGELAVDAVPDPRRLNRRLQRLTQHRSPQQAALPLLFRIFGSREPVPSDTGVRPASAERKMDAERSEDDPRYLKKPSFFDRFFRRKKR